MTINLPEKSTETLIAELQRICGPPPVLSSEDPTAYHELLSGFLTTLPPVDFMLLIMVRQLADALWDVMRYARHKRLLMERRFRQRLEFQAKRRNTRRSLGKERNRAAGGARKLSRRRQSRD
jgi:hypothetical protein